MERDFYKGIQDISIHALRKECDCTQSKERLLKMISIHALRKECD